MVIQWFLFTRICKQHLGRLQIGAIMFKASMNVGVKIFVWTCVSILLGK